MNVLKELIAINRNSETPIYLQVTQAVVRQIRGGLLSRGAKLPGAGALGDALGINRKTVQSAYDELMAQGWIDILPRKGAFVALEAPAVKPKAISANGNIGSYPQATSFAFSSGTVEQFPPSSSRRPTSLILDGGLPDIRLAPLEELAREYRALTKRNNLASLLNYGQSAGSGVLVETLVQFLRETRGLPIRRENLMITRGAQMAFHISARLLMRPGDHVAVGVPGYVNINAMFRQFGGVIDMVPVDDDGLRIELLESLCRKTVPRLLYVLPHHHYPTNATLPPERRIRLLEMARRYRFAIVEDDFDYDFEYDSGPFLPMASLDDHGNVIYVGTLAKTLFPSMRVGFLVGPSNFVRSALQIRRSIDLQGDTLMETAVAGLYRSGAMKAHIRKAVKVYRERRDHMSNLLLSAFEDRISFKVPTGGMGFWAHFANSDLDRVAHIAFERGLTMSDRIRFNPGSDDPHWARLGFASLEPREQERAIGILRDSLAEADRLRVRTR